ncbi:LEM domain-containing protein 1 isoform X4 [Brienomyrus brachyistius]|uniref:LEM domain-containing protein 1 isoform X4 n=1 Tax=Brienomyrus brachyistius TaxID=42636 RepID=UPI0020B28C72|nr:LEM domain-containing protein 1 isoform X4 [Brienomyrus brachyistius]
MPSFVEEPARLSKRRLRQELAADGGKEAYTGRCRRHVAPSPGAGFSSDEDEGQGPAGDGGEEAGIQDEGQNQELEVMDVSQLTDTELKARLLQYGVNVGPIVASTRTLYEKKLRVLLKPVSQPPLNGAGYAAQYSDVEEDEDDDADDEEHDYGSVHAGGHLEADEEQDQVGDSPDLMKDRNATSKSPAFSPKPSVFRPQFKANEPVSDILMEMFPGTERTPTGISATCRRPIKGAAGRPVQFKYPDTPSSPGTKERRELQRHLVPKWIQMLVFLLVAFLFYLIFSAMQDALDRPSTVLLDRSGHEGELLGNLSSFATSEDPPLVAGEE